MRKQLDTATSIVLTVLAIFVTAKYALTASGRPVRAERSSTSARMRGWSDALVLGHRLSGDSLSAATLVMFGDLECPACRGFNEVLQKAIVDHPRDLRVLYISYPLPYHRFALPAARATECAARLGNVARWLDIVYRKQDSLGLKSWGAFAHDAGITDTASVAACAIRPATFPAIDAGLRLGQTANIPGTPAIAIDGWMFSLPPTGEQIDSAIRYRQR
jgi:protein-disulfide isomerase